VSSDDTALGAVGIEQAVSVSSEMVKMLANTGFMVFLP